MDFSSADDWMSELEMEDLNLIHQCHEVNSPTPSVDEFILSSFSEEIYSPCIAGTTDGRAFETSKMTEIQNSFPSSHVCGQSDPSTDRVQQSNNNLNNHYMLASEDHDYLYDTLEIEGCKGRKKVQSTGRPPLQAKTHVMAERKRRQKLNQKLIALAALIPGLRRMDKATVLGDAAKYIEQLQKRVQTLEAQVKGKDEEPTVHSIKLCRPSGDNDSSSSNEDLDGNFNKPWPEIQARISDKNVIVRLYCDKGVRIIEKLLNEVGKLGLHVVNSSVIPFHDTALDITVLAQMTDEFSMTAKEVVINLKSTVLRFQ